MLNQNPSELVVPTTTIPPQATHEIMIGDQRILLRNEIMYTPYQHSCGEHSHFMLALRDEKKILGHQCPTCGQIICPPFMKRCPECDFAEMRVVEMPDRGEMVASPTITYFGNARFKTKVPFALGYAYLGESQTALLLLAYTTKGVLRSGIFKKGTPIKVVFKDERIGNMSDLFVVPAAELSPPLLEKRGVLESDLRWEAADKPSIDKTEAYQKAFAEVTQNIKAMIEGIPKSKRAIAAIVDWHIRIAVETGGGNFGLELIDGAMREIEDVADPDLTLVVQDPIHLVDWVNGKSLTNMVADGQVWIDRSEGLNTIFLLDRLPRALRRDRAFSSL